MIQGKKPALFRFREERLPTLWCKGCGNHIVLTSLLAALNKLKYDPEKTVIVSGIGCASRASFYIDCDTVHTLHGRALPFAAGIKATRPDLSVIVIMGDGDAASIGGNHLIHAARRNLDVTTLCFNNLTYGMTGGQFSATTPITVKSRCTPTLSEKPFDLMKLVMAAGASYAARVTVSHTERLILYLVNALSNPGFSFVEALASCPTHFGRHNNLDAPMDNIRWLETNFEPGEWRNP